MPKPATAYDLLLRISLSAAESELLARRLVERMDAMEKERALRHAQLMKAFDDLIESIPKVTP